MTEQDFTRYMKDDAMLDLLCFSNAMDDLILAVHEQRITPLIAAADPNAAARLRDIAAHAHRLLAALAYLNPTLAPQS